MDSAGGEFDYTLGTEIFIPAQILPAANISTIYDRWQSWSFLTTAGVGSKHHSHEVESRIAKAPLKAIAICKDNLGVNHGMMCLQEEQLLALQNEGLQLNTALFVM